MNTIDLPDKNETRKKYLTPAFLLIIMIILALRLPISQNRWIDVDEFQHLHSTRCIAEGQIIYKDFFEHHTPLFQFTLIPCYLKYRDTLDYLFACRYLMIFHTCLIVLMTFLTGFRLFGKTVALAGTVFLLLFYVFQIKTIDIRPDLLLTSAWLSFLLLMMRNPSNRVSPHNFWPGIFAGLAVLSSPKILLCLGGIILFKLIVSITGKSPVKFSIILWNLLILSLGFLTALMPVILYFYLKNGLFEFIQNALLLNLEWKHRFLPTRGLQAMFSENPLLTTLSILGAIDFPIARIRAYRKIKSKENSMALRKHTAEYPRSVFYAGFLLAVSTLFLMPEPYRQTYLLFLPLISLLAARFVFVRILSQNTAESLKTNHLARQLNFSLLYPIIALALYVLLPYNRLLDFAPGGLKKSFFFPIIWLIGFSFTSLIYKLRFRSVALLTFVITLSVFPLSQYAKLLDLSNLSQCIAVKFTLNHTEADDIVADGWSGYGFLRNHAYFYFFLHRGIAELLTEKQKSDLVVKAFEEKNPELIIYDHHIRYLSPKVRSFVEKHYSWSGYKNFYLFDPHRRKYDFKTIPSPTRKNFEKMVIQPFKE